MIIDATYLASLVLAFIAVHEQAHIVHNHNSLGPPAADPQIDAIVEASLRVLAEDEGAIVQDLRGSTQHLEQDADCFPFELVPPDYLDALLEASSLWLTALAVSGHPVFVFADGQEEVRLQAGPGDYIFVPPYAPHREENPSTDEEAVVVIARSTQEGVVVNLPSLWAPVDRPEN